MSDATLAALMLLSAPLVQQGLLETRLAEPNLYESQSNKPIVDLEFCVARSIASTLAFPFGAYHDGKDRLVVYGSRIGEFKVYLLVILTESPQGTKIEVKGRNPDSLKGFRERLESCI